MPFGNETIPARHAIQMTLLRRSCQGLEPVPAAISIGAVTSGSALGAELPKILIESRDRGGEQREQQLCLPEDDWHRDRHAFVVSSSEC